jgi:hypothetical protein
MKKAADHGIKPGHQAGLPPNQLVCGSPKISGEYSGERYGPKR